MAEKGLRSWVKENWVDIANKKSDGSYPKCVPIAKARGMSKGQKRSAVARKQKASNTGPKPSNVRTLAKNGGYMGSFIKLDVDGKTIGNPSLKKYYKGMV